MDEEELIGTRVLVKKWDDAWHPAEIIEVRRKEGHKCAVEYYVHYDGFNRRLDTWVSKDRVDLTHKLEPKPEAGSAGGAGLQLDGDLAAGTGDSDTRKLTRNQKRKFDEINVVSQTLYEVDPALEALEKEHEQITKVKYVECIQFGRYEVETWYYSPYPDEFGRCSKLWICEYCVKYMQLEKTFRFHLSECTWRHPPGTLLYKKDTIAVYEVDGARQKVYCQNLCLLAKLFLDHKTLYFDVEPFLFYIMVEVDRYGSHLVGYFSKEKDTPENNNLACILTLPQHQKKGYGNFLIQFSYELSKAEGVIGGPERPLSDLGRISYRSFWTWKILTILGRVNGRISIEKITTETAIQKTDVLSTLQVLGLLKYFRGDYVVHMTPEQIKNVRDSSRFRVPRVLFDPDYFYEPAPKLSSGDRR